MKYFRLAHYDYNTATWEPFNIPVLPRKQMRKIAAIIAEGEPRMTLALIQNEGAEEYLEVIPGFLAAAMETNPL